MIDESVYELLKCFQKSYINAFGEAILKEKGNVYFTINKCKCKKDIVQKLLEWCSRPMAKGEPYCSEKRNVQWRNELISYLNDYLNTNFTETDMCWIYDRLGNAVDPELTEKFIESGFDMSLILPNKGE